MKQTKTFALVKVSLFLLLSMFLSVSASSHAAEPGPSLRDAAAGTNRLIGTAINYGALTSDPVYAEIAASEYNVIVLENSMKMKYLQPTQGNFDFSRADTVVNWGRDNGMQIRGHTLIWHNNVPSWIYNRSWTRNELLAVMEEHIHTVMGHYRGQIYAWDVVNEAIDLEGDYRRSVWYNVIGPEFMDYAFQFAHEADPDALLFYNDYSAEEMTHKADVIYNIVADMVARGVPIHGVGMQMHRRVSQGTRIDSVRQNIQRLADLGLQVQFTEIDIRMDGEGGSQQQRLEKQAEEYRAITEVCAQAPACTAIVTWGFTDRYTWIEQRHDADEVPLPFDVNFQPKPAYFSMRDMVAQGVPAIGSETGTPFLLANDDSYGGQQDQPLSVGAPGVLANDETEEGTIQVVDYTAPANGSVVVNSDGSFNYAPFAGFHGYDEFTYTITDGSSQRSASVRITVQPTIPAQCAPVYRVNVGGDELPADGLAWSADTEATPSAYVNAAQSSNKTTSSTDPVTMTHPSLTPEIPMLLFQSERYNNNAGVPMRWGFPVAQGTYTVNLYLAERYFDLAGNRAYDVSIEGEVVLDNFDPYTIAGADAGFMQTFVVNSDTILNVEFANVIQNAAVMGIEILAGSGCVTEPPITNTPPVAADDAASTVQGLAVTIPVLSNDTDADGDTLSFAGVTDPQNGIVVMGDTQITYQPNEGFAGADSFTYTISDGTDTATATVTIEVTPEIVEPTETPTPVETEEPNPNEQTVCEPIYRVNAGGDEIAAADADEGYPNWSADTSSNPSPYVNAQQSSNKVASTANAIDMSDPSLANLLDVVPEALFQTERYNENSDVPMIWSFTMPAGEYTVRLYLAELYFEEAGNRNYDIFIEQQQVQDNFEPFAYAGSDMRGFVQEYEVITDGLLEIEFVNQLQNAMVMGLEILVCGTGNKTVNVPPTPENDEVSVLTGVPASIDPLQNDSDPDGDELNLVDIISTAEQTVSTEIIIGSGGGTIEQNGNMLTYTSAPGFEGTEIFAYTVSDGAETATALITIHVSAPEEVTPTPPTEEPTEEPTAEPTEPTEEPTEEGNLGAPSISPVGNQNTAEGSSVSLQIQATDPDGGALRYIAEGLPAGLGIDAASGLISGVPTQAGNYPVSLRVVAADGDEGTASFTWTITSAGGQPPSSNFLVEIKRNGTDNAQQAQFEYSITNVSSSAQSNFNLRLYFTVDNGLSAGDYVLEKYWDQSGSATISGPAQLSGSIHYFTVSYAATLNPGASWRYHGNLRLQNWSSNNNTANDWWKTGGLGATMSSTSYIPLYQGSNLVYGQEPNGSQPPVQPTQPPVQPTQPPVQPTQPPVQPTQPPVQPTQVPGGALSTEIKTSTVNNQQAQFQIRLRNTGGAQSNVSFRIYFTVENGRAASNYVLDTYWDQSGAANISGPTQHSGNTYFYTVSYGSTSLGSNASWEFHGSLHLNDWRNDFNPGNDWWLGVTGNSFQATNRLPVYVNGSLVAGSQP